MRPARSADCARSSFSQRHAEEPLGGRLHAVGALAEVHGVQVLLEDAVLGPLVVETERQRGFLDLAVQVALGVLEDPVLDQLLGDGRAALLDLPRVHVGHEGPHHGLEVHTGVVVEGAVLGGDDGVDQGLRDLVQLRGPAVPETEGVEVVTVAVVDLRRLVELLEQRRDLARVLAAAGDLLDAGNERGDAHTDADPTEDQDHEKAQQAARSAFHGEIEVPTWKGQNRGASPQADQRRRKAGGTMTRFRSGGVR